MQYSRHPAGGPRRFRQYLTCLCLALALVACLERSNPFDPLNQVTPIVDKFRKENRAAVDSLVLAGRMPPQELQSFLADYGADTLANTDRKAENQSRSETNAARDSANAARTIANEATANPDSLRDLVRYILLDEYVQIGPYTWLESARSLSRDAIIRITSLMMEVNASTHPVLVYPPTYVDSVLLPLRRDLRMADSLALRIEEYNDAIALENALILQYNKTMAARNWDVDNYNIEIGFRREALRKGMVTHPDSLDAAAQAAIPGDTILLGPGIMEVDLRTFSSGTPENPIFIRGYPGRKTILKARRRNDSTFSEQAANLTGVQNVNFEDLIFRGGPNSGIKLTNGSREIWFRRCLFDSNGVWGIDASDSDLKLEDCEILGNGGGIRVAASSGSDVEIDLRNVLIARNRGRGIEAVTPEGSIANSTVSDNGGDGLHIASHQRKLAVENTIFSGNTGYGIYREPTSSNQKGLTVKTCVLWENRVPEDSTDDWSLVNLDSAEALSVREGILIVNPLFVDPGTFDYNLRRESRLVSFENNEPFVVIGYRRKW